MSLSLLAYSDLSRSADEGGERRRLRDINSMVRTIISARFERSLDFRSTTNEHAGKRFNGLSRNRKKVTDRKPEDGERK